MFLFFKNGGEDKNDEIQAYIKEKLYYLDQIKQLQERRSSLDIWFNNFFDEHMKKIEERHRKIEELVKKINPKLGKQIAKSSKNLFD